MLASLARTGPVAILALADGSVFMGESVGAPGLATGMAVFNTAMDGYQEILTDPASRGQVLVLTCPHIGNCGVSEQAAESDRAQVAALVVRDVPPLHSHFRAQQGLRDWLRAQGTVAVSGIDTRELTLALRSSGSQGAAVLALQPGAEAGPEHREQVLAAARAVAPEGTPEDAGSASPYDWPAAPQRAGAEEQPLRVAVYDFGVRRSTLRALAQRGCSLRVLPADTPLQQVLAEQPDGILLSGGPGAPDPATPAVSLARELLAGELPVLGLGLGHQALALAAGATAGALAQGHRGANYPVGSTEDAQVGITTQNHGFAVDRASLPESVQVTHVSLFDRSVQGLRYGAERVTSFQGGPDPAATAGGSDDVLGRFVARMRAARAQ